MISKNERVMEYIAHLEAGEKVSVRGLAQALGVSEGTAYKSIKQAEAQGLVITKPKVGTVRITLKSSGADTDSTMAEAARSVGAACVCGADIAAETELPYILVADGNEMQLTDNVRRAGGSVLCVLGDRPEFHTLAVELGCHILLTGGSLLSDELMTQAEKKGLCVFVSEQDSSTLLGMLNHRINADLNRRDMSQVRDWMQLPRYLYHDDMVTEWYRLYSEMYFRGASCAVVDDSLRICGTVEAMAAMNAAPTLQLSQIMDSPAPGSFVSEDMAMEELAEMLVKSDRLFTSVNSSDGMSGFIGMSDVLRYFLYSRSYRRFDSEDAGKLEIASEDTGGERRLYTLQLAEPGQQINRSAYVNNIYSAAAWHAHYILGGPVALESGSVNTLETPLREGEYLISSTVLKRSGDELLMELELYNDRASYAKASLRYKSITAQQ